jgi:WD40 repeat protein
LAVKVGAVAMVGHRDTIDCWVLSADGKTLASAYADNTVKVWEVVSGKNIATLGGHSKRVNLLAFSPDGKMLVSCGRDRTIKVWRIVGGE